jgi:hypothetical protein
MRRERTLQVVLALVALFYVALIYPRCAFLWHSNWLLSIYGLLPVNPRFRLIALGAYNSRKLE